MNNADDFVQRIRGSRASPGMQELQSKYRDDAAKLINAPETLAWTLLAIRPSEAGFRMRSMMDQVCDLTPAMRVSMAQACITAAISVLHEEDTVLTPMEYEAIGKHALEQLRFRMNVLRSMRRRT